MPGAGTVHQHLNSGTRQSRYLALTGGSHGLVKPYGGSYGTGSKSMNEGGSQIEYEDEERAIHDLFEAELTSVGATCRMKAFIPWCTGEVGPTSERDT